MNGNIHERTIETMASVRAEVTNRGLDMPSRWACDDGLLTMLQRDDHSVQGEIAEAGGDPDYRHAKAVWESIRMVCERVGYTHVSSD